MPLRKRKNKSRAKLTAKNKSQSSLNKHVQAKVEETKEELAKIQQQAQDYLNGWKRARADYLNREKQIVKEKERWIKFANQELILQLLPVMESLEQALQQIPAALQEDQWIKGIRQIKSQLKNFFQAQGVEKIATKGEKFDPYLHEIVDKRPKQSDQAKTLIIEEAQPGYKMRGEVIKPAKVIVQ